MAYDLEISNVISKIKKSRSKRVLIQLPDGLKPRAKEIVDSIEKGTKAEVIIWLGSCYGACDIPQNVKSLGVDMIIQFGHNEFVKGKGW